MLQPLIRRLCAREMSDGMILVLWSNATRRECARKAKEMIEIAPVRLLGAVRNKRTFRFPPAFTGSCESRGAIE
jgi:Mrp family chromosome partitioning ATPase